MPIHSLKEIKKNVPTTIDTLPQTHIHTTLTSAPSPLFTFLTQHPKFPLPLLSNCVHWSFPEGRSLHCRSPLASSVWLLWQGKVNPGRFVIHSDGDSLSLTCVSETGKHYLSPVCSLLGSCFFLVFIVQDREGEGDRRSECNREKEHDRRVGRKDSDRLVALWMIIFYFFIYLSCNLLVTFPVTTVWLSRVGGVSLSAFFSLNLQDLPTQIMVRITSQTAECVDCWHLTMSTPFASAVGIRCVFMFTLCSGEYSACYFYPNLIWEVNNSYSVLPYLRKYPHSSLRFAAFCFTLVVWAKILNI